MSKRLDISQVSILPAVNPTPAVHYGKCSLVPEASTNIILPLSTSGQNDKKTNSEAFWQKTIAVYCLYVKLAGDFRMLPGTENLNSPLYRSVPNVCT